MCQSLNKLNMSLSKVVSKNLRENFYLNQKLLIFTLMKMLIVYIVCKFLCFINIETFTDFFNKIEGCVWLNFWFSFQNVIAFISSVVHLV